MIHAARASAFHWAEVGGALASTRADSLAALARLERVGPGDDQHRQRAHDHFFALVTGALADRLDRRRTMVLVDRFRTLSQGRVPAREIAAMLVGERVSDAASRRQRGERHTVAEVRDRRRAPEPHVVRAEPDAFAIGRRAYERTPGTLGEMATLEELALVHTPVAGDALAHLQRLALSWRLLADLSFADLLLLAPIAQRGRAPVRRAGPGAPDHGADALRHRPRRPCRRRGRAAARDPGVAPRARRPKARPTCSGQGAGAPALHPRPLPGAGDRDPDPRGADDLGPTARRARALLPRGVRPARPHGHRGDRSRSPARRSSSRGRPASATG